MVQVSINPNIIWIPFAVIVIAVVLYAALPPIFENLRQAEPGIRNAVERAWPAIEELKKACDLEHILFTNATDSLVNSVSNEKWKDYLREAKRIGEIAIDIESDVEKAEMLSDLERDGRIRVKLDVCTIIGLVP